MTKSEQKQDSGSRRKKPANAGLSGSVLHFEERTQRHLLLFFLALVLTIIIIPKGGFIPDYHTPGDVASRDIKAPKDLLIPDPDLTEKKRQESAAAVLPLYDYDPRAGQEVAERLVQGLTALQAAGSKGGTGEPLQHDVEALLGVSLSGEDLEGLLGLPLDEASQQAAPVEPVEKSQPVLSAAKLLGQLRGAVLDSLGQKVVGNLQLFQAELDRGIVVRDLVARTEVDLADPKEVIGLGDAQGLVRDQLKAIEGLSARQRQALEGLIRGLLRPNLTFNKNETEARKEKAREEVKPVLFQVKKGEMIVREGERITADQIKKLRALREMGSHYSTLTTGLGLLLCLLLVICNSHRFAKYNISKYRPNNRDHLFLVTTFVGLFILIKVAIFMSTALESAFPYIESSSYYYVFPFAVGAMLVRIVLYSEVALIFAILSSLAIGILFGNSLYITIYALVGSLTGAHWVRQCKERTTLYIAGLRLSLVNILLIFGMHVMAGRPFDIQLLYKCGFGLAGGFICAVIVNGTIPLVEYLFKYTTDIKLLELANMNQPVLRELMVQAPGTYHHSIIVGNLVEAAAEAINANPLLARVAAYYHDVGKIRKPLYFVENLGRHENRHDKLAPSMSALILMAHVKDGVELARESKLGDPLVDIIRQHHGTALIKFFYDKAKSKEDPVVQQVDERDYRYPGPKPQTREAALIMLADAVEAASRTLTDPTSARIQGMVQKIINNIFIDGQLDECELTLKDLHNIAKSFNRILSGIFHHRVDYPEPAYKERDKESVKRKTVDDTHREPPKPAKDRDPDTKKGSPEDLKRLGMS